MDLPCFQIINQGKAVGKAEGEQEIKALKIENGKLREEIERLKAAMK